MPEVLTNPIVISIDAIEVSDKARAKINWNDYIAALDKHRRLDGDQMSKKQRRLNGMPDRLVVMTPHLTSDGIRFRVSTDLTVGITKVVLESEYSRAS